jgi:hypothetical protein
MKGQSAIVVLCLVSTFGTVARTQQVQADVRDFVRGSSFPNSYRELSDSYDPSVVPQLIEMLSSKEEETHWDRIVGLLGAIGDERAVAALIAFLEKPVETDRLSVEHHDAYRAAIMSLGTLVNRTGDERALEYLIDGLTPSVWRQRGVQGIAPWAGSYEESDRELSKYALMGLALSGHPQAREALVSLQHSPTIGQAQFRSGLDSTLEQWLEVHQLVAERGLAGMYDHYEALRHAKEEREAEEAQKLRDERAERESLRQAQQPQAPGAQ